MDIRTREERNQNDSHSSVEPGKGLEIEEVELDGPKEGGGEAEAWAVTGGGVGVT